MPSIYGDLTAKEIKALEEREALNQIMQGGGSGVNQRLATSSLEGIRTAAQGNLKRGASASENKKDREALLQRQQMKNQGRAAEASMIAAAMGSDPYAGLTDPEARIARQQAQTFTGLDDAIEKGEGIIAGGGDFKGVTDTVVGALRSWDLQGTANTLANLVYEPEEKAARSAFGSAIGEWRRSLSGSAVTGIEQTLGADWDPTASGIGQVEAVSRAKRLQGYINGNRDVLGLPSIGGAASAPRGRGNQPKYKRDAQGNLLIWED